LAEETSLNLVELNLMLKITEPDLTTKVIKKKKSMKFQKIKKKKKLNHFQTNLAHVRMLKM